MDLASVYDAWAPRLLAYMMTITRDPHRAEDGIQNLFVKLATSRPDLHSPVVYLFRAARNEALRVAKRRPERPLSDLHILAPREGDVELSGATRRPGSLHRQAALVRAKRPHRECRPSAEPSEWKLRRP